MKIKSPKRANNGIPHRDEVQPSGLREFLKTLLWLMGSQVATKYVFIVIGQVFVSVLEFVFLSLTYSLLATIVSKSGPQNVFGVINISSFSVKSLLLAVVLTVLAKGVVSISLKYYSSHILADRETDVTISFAQKSIFEKRDSFNSRHSTEFLHIYTEVIPSVFRNILNPLTSVVADFFTITVIIVSASKLLPFNNFWLAFYLVGFGITISFPMAKYMKKKNLKVLQLGKSTLKRFREFAAIREVLYLSHDEDVFIRELQDQQRELVQTRSQVSVLLSLPRYYMEFILVFGFATFALFGRMASGSAIGIASMGIVVAIGFRVLPPLNSLLTNYSVIKGSVPSLRRIVFLAERFGGLESLSPCFPTRSQKKNSYQGKLVVSNLEFRYMSAEKSVLNRVNFTIPENETLLIEGASGSGKTTLVGIVAGLLLPSAGEVYLLSQGKKIAIDENMTGISYLDQNAPLLDKSFAYNIALRNPSEIEMVKVIDCAAKAGILDRVNLAINSFDTKLGENGSHLSAGERQRLALARALYKDPKLLILDEPTANLDSITESSIWETLVKLKHSLTILLISHRSVPAEVFDSKICL